MKNGNIEIEIIGLNHSKYRCVLVYLRSVGINHALYTIKPPTTLNNPVYNHFRFVYNINNKPQNTPTISHAPDHKWSNKKFIKFKESSNRKTNKIIERISKECESIRNCRRSTNHCIQTRSILSFMPESCLIFNSIYLDIACAKSLCFINNELISKRNLPAIAVLISKCSRLNARILSNIP